MPVKLQSVRILGSSEVRGLGLWDWEDLLSWTCRIQDGTAPQVRLVLVTEPKLHVQAVQVLFFCQSVKLFLDKA